MQGFLIHNARIVTLRSDDAASALPRRRTAMRELGVIPLGYIVVRGDRIERVEAGTPSAEMRDLQPIDAAGGVVTPGFVDCHTHACWAGDRWDEWEMKLAGSAYLEILAAGGGIHATVRAVRAASTNDLAQGIEVRTRQMAAYGTTTVEVKSGYGMDCETELRMLDAIDLAASRSHLRIVKTYLGAHAIDPSIADFVERTIDTTLPAVMLRHPRITIDAYCEKGSWSVEECVRYFTKGAALGAGVRVHTDQFNSLGMLPAALSLGAMTVDHLEAATDDDLDAVARSSTIAVGLPATAFCLGTPTIRARRFIDGGGALALATNANPGSAPVRGMPIVVSFAVREMNLTPAEALTTVTWNAACALGLSHICGSIEIGKSADLVWWPVDDERALGYELSGALPLMVMARGALVLPRHSWVS